MQKHETCKEVKRCGGKNLQFQDTSDRIGRKGSIQEKWDRFNLWKNTEQDSKIDTSHALSDIRNTTNTNYDKYKSRSFAAQLQDNRDKENI